MEGPRGYYAKWKNQTENDKYSIILLYMKSTKTKQLNKIKQEWIHKYKEQVDG